MQSHPKLHPSTPARIVIECSAFSPIIVNDNWWTTLLRKTRNCPSPPLEPVHRFCRRFRLSAISSCLDRQIHIPLCRRSQIRRWQFGQIVSPGLGSVIGLRQNGHFIKGPVWINSKTFLPAGTCFMWRSSLRASLLVILELTPATQQASAIWYTWHPFRNYEQPTAFRYRW